MSLETENQEVEPVEPSTTTEDQPDKAEKLVSEDVLVKVKHKWKSQARAAQEEVKVTTEQFEAKIKALENEKSLLTTALGGQQEPAPLVAPSQYDYDDDADYQVALQDYISEMAEKKYLSLEKQKRDEAERKALEDQALTLEESERKQQQEAIFNYQETASDLGSPEFAEVEAKLLGVFTDDMHMFVMQQFPEKAAAITLELGNDLDKAKEILDLAATNPVGAAFALKDLADTLEGSKSNHIVNPDEPASGGGSGGGSDWDARISALRKTGDTNAVIALKREARANGWVEH